jgi:hypothetical protein
VARPPSRGWSAAETFAILTEDESYQRVDTPPGALLRRLGASTSQISTWRKQRDRSGLARLAPQPPGPKPQPSDPLHDQVERLRKEHARLPERPYKAETLIESQKKLHRCLACCYRRHPATPADTLWGAGPGADRGPGSGLCQLGLPAE